MLNRDTVIKTIDKLPDTFSIDELIDELIFAEKVQKGLEQSNSGNVYSKEQAKAKLGKWLK
jgi:hypothetical protein